MAKAYADVVKTEALESYKQALAIGAKPATVR